MRQNLQTLISRCAYLVIGLATALLTQSANCEELTEEFLTSHNVYQAYMTGPWAGTYQGCYDYNYGGAYFESNGDGSLKLHNFYTDGIDVDATLSNNSLEIQLKDYKITRGKYSGYTATLVPISWEFNTTTIEDKTYAYIVPNKYYDYSQNYKIQLYYQYGDSWDNWSMRYQSNIPGLVIDIKDAEGKTVDALSFIDGYFSVRDVPNAKARDYDKDGKLIREYNVTTSWIETGLYISNLNCRGLRIATNHGISAGLVEITASWPEWTNELWYRSQTIGVTTSFSNFESLGYQTINNKDAYWYSYDPEPTFCEVVNDAFEQQKYKNGGTAEEGEVHGEFCVTGKDVDHNHIDTNCPWIDCDGDRLTRGGYAIKLYNYGLLKKGVTKEDGSKDYLEEYSYTEITGTDADYTLGVDLDLAAFGANKNCIYVKGSIIPQKNTLFVDHYELCVKADNKESVTQFPTVDEGQPFATDDDDEYTDVNDYRVAANGFPRATNLYNLGNIGSASANSATRIARLSSSSEKSDNADDVIEFEKLISTSDLTEVATNPRDYRFYVKAIYKSEYYDEAKGINQGLSPTYHAISAFEGQLTGVEDVKENGSNVAITGGQGEINIVGEFNNATVYSASGAVIYSGNSNAIAVPSGIYIVKADDTTAKVFIK